MENQNAVVAELLAAHERDILTLQTEVSTLKTELAHLRADMLASLKRVFTILD
jgi:hypothetical protein